MDTTGLYARHDKIIEIGAVKMRGGEEIDRFQTFVDPGCLLSREVSNLTGITDQMLKGAPKIDTVMPELLDFIGDRVIVAHNADFDLTFIQRACDGLGISHAFTYVDTLTIAQNLMPELPKYKLDVVAKTFGLGDFNHHRAADDAVICGKIMANLFPKPENLDIYDVQSINEKMLALRPVHRQETVRCQHIVLFAKNQMGLRNLYHLISDSNLKHFRKFPRIFKSELMKLREGLIIGSACENNEIYQAALSGKSWEELERLAAFYDYLEVQPLSNNRFMLDEGKRAKPPLPYPKRNCGIATAPLWSWVSAWVSGLWPPAMSTS